MSGDRNIDPYNISYKVGYTEYKLSKNTYPTFCTIPTFWETAGHN